MNGTKNGSWPCKDREVPYLYGSEIWAILCVIARKKINSLLLCVKNHANIYLLDVLTWKL